jgi:hypothetical protein
MNKGDPEFCPEASEAIDLAKRSGPEDEEITVGGLMAAVFHVGGFGAECPELAVFLPEPQPLGSTVPAQVELSGQLEQLYNLLTADDPQHHRRFNLDAQYDEVSIDELMAVLFFSEFGLDYLRYAGASEDVLGSFVKALFERLARSILVALHGHWLLMERRGGILGETSLLPGEIIEFREDGTAVHRGPQEEPWTASYHIELVNPRASGTRSIEGKLEPCLIVGRSRRLIRLDHHAGTLTLEDDFPDGFTETYSRIEGSE